MDAEIQIIHAGSPKDIPPRVAKLILWRRDKTLCIEPRIEGSVRGISVADTVGPGRIACVGVVERKSRCEGHPRLDLINACQGPSSS